jgi:hypothetical protein
MSVASEIIERFIYLVSVTTVFCCCIDILSFSVQQVSQQDLILVLLEILMTYREYIFEKKSLFILLFDWPRNSLEKHNVAINSM